jgi:hypothetical protein
MPNPKTQAGLIRLPLALCAAVLICVLSACGGSGDGGTAPATGSSASAKPQVEGAAVTPGEENKSDEVRYAP